MNTKWECINPGVWEAGFTEFMIDMKVLWGPKRVRTG